MGCSSTTTYSRADYSNAEIRAIEIKNIAKNLEEKPVYSLWKAWLLKNKDVAASDLFNDCVNYCADLYARACESDDYINAFRYCNTLKIVAPEKVEKISCDKYFDNTYSFTANTIPEDEHVKISRFLNGTVTIWINLGVKVERGLGYANRVIGSGFFIGKDGWIITNYHVIADTVDPSYKGYSRLYIKLFSDPDTRIPARVVSYDKSLDLALLKTEIDAPYTFTLGSSTSLDVGDTIYAIGSPIGLNSTITSGIVSSFDRKVMSTASIIQIDAAVNAGNSGGPLINKKGEVQGIVFAGIPDYQGLNFAIPVEYLKTVLPRLFNCSNKVTDTDEKIIIPQEIHSSWIGAYGKTYKLQGDPKGRGVQVLYTMPGGSCDLAGIRSGNIITHINQKKIASVEELQNELIALPPEMVTTLTIRIAEAVNQKDTNKMLSYEKPIYLAIRPEYPGVQMRERDSETHLMYPFLGMKLKPASAKKRSQCIVDSIVKGSIADESGFSKNDSVTVKATELSADKNFLLIEFFTKKRKSGYLDVNLMVGAPMDSPLFF
ncbi:MAG TPA: S1C family serine protease [Treponemataceae bacterium]|nr:S1C family serine protease [Treponemataceae bacterium]